MAEKKKAPIKKAPVKKAPVKKAPVKKTPVKKAPVKKETIKKEPAKKVEKKTIMKNEVVTKFKKLKGNEDLIKSITLFVGGILLGILVILTFTSTKIPTLDNGEELVAKINDVDFTNNAVYDKVKNSYGLDALITMVDTEILTTLYPEDEAMIAYVDSDIEYWQSVYPDDFDQVLSEAGYQNVEKYREIVALSYRRNLYNEEYAKLLVTDDEINDYYEDTVKNEIRASHILIEPIYADGVTSDTATEEQATEASNAALTLAKSIITKLDNGEDFATLAAEYSNDGSATDGGDLGFFRENMMVPAFEEAAYALSVDSYTTTPVNTAYGYHIILKTDEKEKESIDTLRDEISTTLSQSIISADENLTYKALVYLREESGFEIFDTDIKDQYKLYTTNINAQ